MFTRISSSLRTTLTRTPLTFTPLTTPSLTHALPAFTPAFTPCITTPLRTFYNPIRLRGKGPKPKFTRPAKKRQLLKQRQAAVMATGKLHLPELPALTVPVHRLTDGVVINQLSLRPEIFYSDLSKSHVVYEVVRWQRAMMRQGTAKTKNRAEVNGPGRKPHPQKGTGRARQGSVGSPILVGGGNAHPKIPRSYAYNIPEHIRALALRLTLAAKLKEGNLLIVDSASFPTHKTAVVKRALETNKLDRFLMLYGEGELDANLALGIRAVSGVDVLPVRAANTYAIVRAPQLVLTVKAVEFLNKWLIRVPKHKYLVDTAGKGYSADQVDITK